MTSRLRGWQREANSPVAITRDVMGFDFDTRNTGLSSIRPCIVVVRLSYHYCEFCDVTSERNCPEFSYFMVVQCVSACNSGQ